MDLEALAYIPLPRGHRNADVGIVQKRVVTKNRVQDLDHRRIEEKLVEVRMLPDDDVRVSQVVGLGPRAAGNRLFAIQ